MIDLCRALCNAGKRELLRSVCDLASVTVTPKGECVCVGFVTDPDIRGGGVRERCGNSECVREGGWMQKKETNN